MSRLLSLFDLSHSQIQNAHTKVTWFRSSDEMDRSCSSPSYKQGKIYVVPLMYESLKYIVACRPLLGNDREISSHTTVVVK
jgi:hypothetical protein